MDWHKVIKAATDFPDMKIAEYKRSHQIDAMQTREWFIGFRSLIKNLKVIELSNDLIWAITKLSLEVPPSILMDYALQTRMPFDNVLFTWNANARNKAYLDNNAEVLDPSDAEDEYPAMVVSTGQAGKMITDLSYYKNKLTVFPIAYWLDPSQLVASKLHSAVASLYNPMNIEGETTHHSWHVHFWLTTPIVNKYPDFANHMETDHRFSTGIIPPTGLCMLNKIEKLGERYVGSFKDDFKTIIGGTAGNPRWFAALCTLMSYQSKSKIVQTIEPVKSTEKRTSHSGSNSTWTLFLPREKVVKSAVRHLLIHRKPVGKHEVAGFWSISHRRGDENCHHVWPTEPTRRQVCQNCGALRWWVVSHERGSGPLVDRRRKLDYSGQLSKVISDIKDPK